jgi:hypothetical protein
VHPPVEQAADVVRLRPPTDSNESRAITLSGQTRVPGAPRAAWDVSSGSGAVDITFDRRVGVTLDATSGSSSVRVEGGWVDGTMSKGRASGAIAGGGPTVRLYSRSGSIRVSF